MEQYKAQYPQESNTIATLSERLRAEGMQKGMQQGMQQGEAAALKKLINLKFGELPHCAEEQIQSAGVPKLEVWLEAILTSDTLDSLLNRH
jgi:flagellar biosynthesis/type III secretory pathway protein FliH